MRSQIATAVVLAGLTLLSVHTPAADHYRALEAYERGDYEAALREWKPLAEEGDVEAQYRIARMYYRGEGVRDDAEAARWYRRAAKRGHPIAQNNLGLMYEQGRGVDRDLAEAARWYRQAADQGVTTAQANLARLYDEGRGVTKDPEIAARWYQRAASGGHAESQYRLGRMFDEGRGVPQDPAKALKWYRKAAGNGNHEARDVLAARTPVTPSKKASKKEKPNPSKEPDPSSDRTAKLDEFIAEQEELTETSASVPPPPAPPARADSEDDTVPDSLSEVRGLAEQGDVDAQYRLARIYMRGEGVPQNPDEAGRWLLEAAENGHEMAGYRVAFMYLRAVGISPKKDYVQAYRWFGISARRGIGDAAEWRDKIVKKMSDRELAEAEGLLGEWTED